MEVVILLMFLLTIFTSISFTYIWYQMRVAQKEVQKAIDVCRDVVVFVNYGRWM